ncbi:hypothetical protein ACWCOW_17515 [Streptomyces sp. NPDC001939]
MTDRVHKMTEELRLAVDERNRAQRGERELKARVEELEEDLESGPPAVAGALARSF